MYIVRKVPYLCKYRAVPYPLGHGTHVNPNFIENEKIRIRAKMLWIRSTVGTYTSYPTTLNFFSKFT